MAIAATTSSLSAIVLFSHDASVHFYSSSVNRKIAPEKKWTPFEKRIHFASKLISKLSLFQIVNLWSDGKKLTRKCTGGDSNVSGKPRINVRKINRLEKGEQSKIAFAQNKPFVLQRKKCSNIRTKVYIHSFRCSCSEF